LRTHLNQIKELGGLTVAQQPNEAEHDAMPRNAIATGRVDYVLPARDMAKQIAVYWEASRRMRLPDEAAPSPEQREDGRETEHALGEILAHVRAQTGHDFAHYKRATVLRRIGRRLQVNNLPDLPAYVGFLRRHPAEVNDLLGDLLISVTQFFRDRETWHALERDVIPRLFEGKGPDDEVRAWVCGCATGEEAYSLAILLREHAARMERPPHQIQVFATDMDADAIAHAREGSYPDTIAVDVSPERLRSWFVRENGRYRVRKELRETVLFALHDVLRDTPFSRLDLVTCRNLLIYLNHAAQERVFEVFHFALRPDGYLLLGSSESTDGASALFGTVDKQHRIYVRRPVAHRVPFAPTAVPARVVPVVGFVGNASGHAASAARCCRRAGNHDEDHRRGWRRQQWRQRRRCLGGGPAPKPVGDVRGAVRSGQRGPSDLAPVQRGGAVFALLGRRADHQPAARDPSRSAHRSQHRAVRRPRREPGPDPDRARGIGREQFGAPGARAGAHRARADRGAWLLSGAVRGVCGRAGTKRQRHVAKR
jgi:chemotaxis methyl-accepting protein methylase